MVGGRPLKLFGEGTLTKALSKLIKWIPRRRTSQGHPMWSPSEVKLLVTYLSEPTPWTRPQMPPGPKSSLPIRLLNKYSTKKRAARGWSPSEGRQLVP